MRIRKDLRNVAIIAHVDHGKTTLVDQLLRQSGIFRSNEEIVERVMDSGDLEKERGITILSKNTAVIYEGVKINIIDTPGHADFGGEVERILTMVDGVLLLVDAFEGCMPQTRFVLKKALALDKKLLVVVNKIDRDGARPLEVVDEVLSLLMELEAKDDLLDFPVVYASARKGYANTDLENTNQGMKPLFEMIINKVPCPEGQDGQTQVLISSIDYDDYVGRIGIGRVIRGSFSLVQPLCLCKSNGEIKNVKITKMYQFEGLKRAVSEKANFGDIICVAGIDDINIGETICDQSNPDPLPFVDIDEPTVSMLFMVNNSPFAGREGKFVTSRNIRDRLFKEIETNVAMRVEETDSADTFKVSGRGELHLSILIETMRRQNFEFSVSRPKVILKEKNGKKLEPVELLVIEVPDVCVGVVMEKLGTRKAELLNMKTKGTGVTELEFRISSRQLMGYRTEFLTDTNGNGTMNHVFDGYEEHTGTTKNRPQGSLIVHETGETTGYGLYAAQDRGRLFVGPGVSVYEGMVIGASPKSDDISVNVCKKKHITNMRASGSDDSLKLTPPTIMSLEQCIEFIKDDELVEVTPKNIRMRKIILDKNLRNKKSKY
ncbi:MAG: translational GTPase TypA [Oscillospiraceae bacterium]|nr:translational GTPase TypA [Oscillospiraceae bacterium]